MSKLTSFALKGRKRLRAYDFVLPLYNLNYIIYIGPSIQEAAIYAETDHPGLELEIEPETGGMAIHTVHENEGNDFMILLSPNQNNADIILSTCAHESLHVSWYMCDLLGIKLDDSNHEAQCYIMQRIFQNCKDSIQDYIKRYRLDIKL